MGGVLDTGDPRPLAGEGIVAPELGTGVVPVAAAPAVDAEPPAVVAGETPPGIKDKSIELK